MTPARVQCPLHGEVVTSLEDISLVVHAISGDRRYLFPCSRCEGLVVREADSRIAAMLISLGVEPELVTTEPVSPRTLTAEDEHEIARFRMQLRNLREAG